MMRFLRSGSNQPPDPAQPVTGQSEQRLAQREQRLSLALGTTDIVGVWDGDLVAGLVFGDETFARIYGVDPAMAARGVPRGFYIRNIHPDDVPAVRAEMDRLFAGEPVYANEHRIVLPDGSIRWVLTRGRMVRDAEGTPTRFAGISVDITERKRAETRQAFLLDLADRLRALSDPTAIIDTAATLLGGHLGANRVAYYQVQPDDVTILAHMSYADDAPPHNGLFTLDVFGAHYVARHRQGLTIVEDDVAADPEAAPAIYEAIRTRAFVSVPLIRDGRFRATLCASQRDKRVWTPEEVALIEGVATRIWDAGERARAEAALRASEAQFRGLAQAIPNHVWTATSDGRLVWFNERVYLFTGAEPGDLDDDKWAATVHPDDLPGVRIRWDACLVSGNIYQTELRIRRHDGTYRWHIARAEPIRGADGSITQWVGTNTDIQDQKTAAQALANLNDTLEQRVLERTAAVRMAEARFRGIFDSTQQLIALLALDGSVLEVNRAAMLFRRTPAGTEALRTALPLAASGEFVRAEWDLVGADGQTRTFDVSLGPVRDDQGQVVMLVLEGRDITERKQLEDQLRQSQKMEAVGQLTGGLAHDFNNLLTGITGSLELLRMRMAQGRTQDLERYIAAAGGAAERAAALTHRLLAFSRRQTLDPRPTDINRLVLGMEDLVRRTMGPAIQIEILTAPDCWNTMVDPPQLENALLNLCINARDAMPDGGTLTVETGNVALAGATARALDLPAGSYVFLRVSDTGTGMAPEVAARAFDPFFTTKPIGMGTGLGLSMIYGFVRQSGGQARIASHPGQGTILSLYLPRHAGSEETQDAEGGTAQPPRAEQGETVLVVDDEATVRMLVTEVLADLGYHAIEAVDGPAGLLVLRTNARIDLLITDVGLPGGMNGRQLADAARTGRPDLKVLFITGYAEAAVIGEGHLDHGMHMLTKPFAMEALARAVKEIIGN